MTGGHHAISEFLAENVLDTLEPSTLDFLMATSITDQICGDLATALSGVPRGLEMLEEVEERDLFLNRIDDQWFGYHHLFAEFLRHRLERDQPDRVAELHRIASQWFAEHRFVSDAVDHALAAGDDQRAVEIIENDGLYMFAHSQMSTLIGWVGKLPGAIVQTHPRLQLALAWANILLHRAEATRRALTLVESTVEESGLSTDEIADVRAEAEVVRGLVALRADHLEGIDEHIAPCLARADSVRPFVARQGGQPRHLRRRLPVRPRRGQPPSGVGIDLFRTQPGFVQPHPRVVLHRAGNPTAARPYGDRGVLPQGLEAGQAVRWKSLVYRQTGEFAARRVALRPRG